ncbi:hypothetical protein CsSME_00009137 [Camellia sinensis var. sinensis]
MAKLLLSISFLAILGTRRYAKAILGWSFWQLSQAQELSNSRILLLKYFNYFKEQIRYKEKKEEVAEPEVDPERDQRTVFAYQISLKADERDVYDFFSRAGKIRSCKCTIYKILAGNQSHLLETHLLCACLTCCCPQKFRASWAAHCGAVRDVRLIMDRNSRRSKGVGLLLTSEDDRAKGTLVTLKKSTC